MFLVEVVTWTCTLKKSKFDTRIFFTFFSIQCLSTTPFLPKNIPNISAIIEIDITPISSLEVNELIGSCCLSSNVSLGSKNYSHIPIQGTTKNPHRAQIFSSFGESIVGNTTSHGRRLESILIVLSHGQVEQTGDAIIIH